MSWSGLRYGSRQTCELLGGSPRKVDCQMAISEDLLEILACPACKCEVQLVQDGKGLKCIECHRVYPIRDDIPVMLIDQATIEAPPQSEPESDGESG